MALTKEQCVKQMEPRMGHIWRVGRL